MVFQSHALYPHLSVADNIAYGLKIRKMSRMRSPKGIQRAADMLELRPFLTASRPCCPVVSASGWRWAGPSCVIPRCS